jgi:hypothetical protein
MSFPTQTISTANLDSGADNPSSARADLLQAVTSLNTIISEKNTANGVVVLNGSGLISTTIIPSTISTTADTLTLNPADDIVKIQNFLRLQSIPKTTLTTIVGNAGDLALCSNADTGGTPALAISDGTNWYFLPKASLTLIS